MPTTTTNVGRQGLVHPDLGYDGGSAQHGLLRDLYTHMSNQTNIYWSGTLTVAGAGTTAVSHNLDMPLANLKVFIVESNATLAKSVQDARYTITEISVNQIQVENISGGSRTFDVYVTINQELTAADVDPAEIATVAGTQNLTSKTVSTTAALTGAFILPPGTTAQRPAAISGYARFNTDTNEFEGAANGTWSSIGGGVNERALKNYYKTIATASVAPGTLSLLASGTANLVSLTAFYANTTSGTAALTQSTSTALRGSANYLTAVTGAALAGTTFVQLPAFSLEGFDLGKPIILNFEVNSTLADGDWDVVVVRYNSSGVHQELISVAGNASSATATPSAKLPGGTSQFNGFFVAGSTAGDLYAVRLRRLVGSTQIRVDTLFAGQEPVRLAGAITDWQQLTFATPTNLGTGSATVSATYARSGDTMILKLRCIKDGNAGSGAGVVTFTMPFGFTIDTTKIPSNFVLGSYAFSGAVFGSHTDVIAITSTTFVLRKNSTAANFLGSDFTAFGEVNTTLHIPIVGWSSNLVTGDRLVEEYAFNTDITSTSSVTASGFGNGGLGQTLLGVSWALGTSYTRRIRFTSPIQSTDALIIEIGNDSGFVAIDTRLGALHFMNGVQYGASYNIINTTDVDITFGNGGYGNPATFGGNGASWSVNLRWRVRKVSGGSQVGFPISARNVLGDTSGNAVPSGNIGQNLKASTLRSAPVTLTSAVDAAATPTITLTSGIWSVSGTIAIEVAAASSVTAGTTQYSISNAVSHPSSDTIGVPTNGLTQLRNASALPASSVTLLPFHSYQVIITPGSTLTLRIVATMVLTGTVTVFGSIEATRIA